MYTGPYLITRVIAPSTAVIQRSRRSKPSVVHFDKLKPYLRDTPISWLGGDSTVNLRPHSTSTEEPEVSHVVVESEMLPPSGSPAEDTEFENTRELLDSAIVLDDNERHAGDRSADTLPEVNNSNSDANLRPRPKRALRAPSYLQNYVCVIRRTRGMSEDGELTFTEQTACSSCGEECGAFFRLARHIYRFRNEATHAAWMTGHPSETDLVIRMRRRTVEVPRVVARRQAATATVSSPTDIAGDVSKPCIPVAPTMQLDGNSVAVAATPIGVNTDATLSADREIATHDVTASTKLHTHEISSDGCGTVQRKAELFSIAPGASVTSSDDYENVRRDIVVSPITLDMDMTPLVECAIIPQNETMQHESIYTRERGIGIHDVMISQTAAEVAGELPLENEISDLSTDVLMDISLEAPDVEFDEDEMSGILRTTDLVDSENESVDMESLWVLAAAPVAPVAESKGSDSAVVSTGRAVLKHTSGVALATRSPSGMPPAAHAPPPTPINEALGACATVIHCRQARVVVHKLDDSKVVTEAELIGGSDTDSSSSATSSARVDADRRTVVLKRKQNNRRKLSLDRKAVAAEREAEFLEHVRSTALRLTSAGSDGLYLDIDHAEAESFCEQPVIPHAPGERAPVDTMSDVEPDGPDPIPRLRPNRRPLPARQLQVGSEPVVVSSSSSEGSISESTGEDRDTGDGKVTDDHGKSRGDFVVPLLPRPPSFQEICDRVTCLIDANRGRVLHTSDVVKTMESEFGATMGAMYNTIRNLIARAVETYDVMHGRRSEIPPPVPFSVTSERTALHQMVDPLRRLPAPAVFLNMTGHMTRPPSRRRSRTGKRRDYN